MPRNSVEAAREWRTKAFERSSANPARSIDFVPGSVGVGGGIGGSVVGGDSDSSDSLFADDLDSDSVAADDDVDSDNAIEAISSQPLCLHKRSRNVSDAHCICPQLMDLCIAGTTCWGHFFTSFRPFKPDVLSFHFHAEKELVLTHDEYLRLVIAVYERYHKGVHPPGTA